MGKLKANKNRILFDLCLLIYAGFLFYLFYNQLLYPLTGIFESDTFVHVRFAVRDHYFHSLASFIYLFLSIFPFENILIALVLTLTSILSIVFSAKLIKKLSEDKISEGLIYIAAFLSNFVMGFYLSFCNKQHYIGYQNANMWHNSTYIFMRLFAIITVILFIDVYKNYKENIDNKKYALYTLFLMLTTGFKASFLTVFAPMLALLLLTDLINKTKFKKVFIMAVSVIPSILIMGIQSVVMSGDGAANGYTISPFTALSMRGDHPKVTIILSVLFPGILFLSHIKDFYKSKYYLWSLIMAAIGFLEVFLFLETGERSLDSNFMWGYSISLFFLFLESIIVLIMDFKEAFLRTAIIKKGFLLLEAILLLWHALSGVWYFGLLLTGVTYFV